YIGGYQNYVFNTGGDDDNSGRTAPFLSPVTATATYPTTTTDFLEKKAYFSNELNLSSRSGGKLQWITGLYQYHEKYSQEVHRAAPDQPELGVLLPFSFITPPAAGRPNPCF